MTANKFQNQNGKLPGNMGYVYKENDLTQLHYDRLTPVINKMRVVALSGAMINEKLDLPELQNIHFTLFGGPRPNIKSGAVIVAMFKKIIRKYDEKSPKICASQPEARECVSIQTEAERPEHKKRGRRPGSNR